MGYTIRVDKYRYTGWFGFNQTAADPDFGTVFGRELYIHDETPLPVDFSVEHVNVVNDPQHSAVVSQLHHVLVSCAQRPDLCPPELYADFV